MAKKRNPGTQRIIDKELAYERNLTTRYLEHKLNTLSDVKGIGKVLEGRIKRHFGGGSDE